MYSIKNFRVFNVCCFSDPRTFFNSELLSIYGSRSTFIHGRLPNFVEYNTEEHKICLSTVAVIYIIVRLQNTGIYEIYNPKALAVAPERSEGTTKGLRVINFIVPVF